MAKEQSILTSACQANEEDLVLLHYGDLAEVERDWEQFDVKISETREAPPHH